MKKTHKVVMLPTEKASRIMFPTDLDKDYNRLAYLNTATNVEGTHPQHLYIISDDDIKEGDWTICGYNIYKWTKEDVEDCLHNPRATNNKGCQKIIATTDKSLVNSVCCISKDGGLTTMNKGCAERNRCLLPQIPESFIQAYIKAYNEGKPITEVDLEVWTKRVILEPDKSYSYQIDESLGLIKGFSNTPSIAKALELGWTIVDVNEIKTRPDNTVIVHQSKIYTKKEVEKLCEKAFRAGREAQSNLNGNKCPSAWIQDNL